ncbi:MAG: Rrf2 family transcriptional regulator [Acidobacteria bacterium]|nr:Rrf2 family transcriptional regulator [Acidobacteriota bacterium]
MGPLNISVKGEYALLALFDLALQRPGEPVKIAGIAQRQKIPQKFLELILAALKQGNFVESRRGADGGYLLSRPPHEINVGDILRFVESGRMGRNQGKRRQETPFSEMWGRVETAVSGILDHCTLAEVARTWQERQSRYIPNWEI